MNPSTRASNPISSDVAAGFASKSFTESTSFYSNINLDKNDCFNCNIICEKKRYNFTCRDSKEKQNETVTKHTAIRL